MSRENHQLFYWGDVEYFHEKTLTPKLIPFRHMERVNQVGCNDDHLVLLLNDGTVYTIYQQGSVHSSIDGSLSSPTASSATNAMKPRLSLTSVANEDSNTATATSSRGDNCVRRIFYRGKKTASTPSVGSGVSMQKVECFKNQTILQVVCSSSFNLALTSNGQVFVWQNPQVKEKDVHFYGPCANQVTIPYLNPLPEFQSKKVTQIACGLHHFLAVCNDYTVYSWGQNQYGELGRMLKKGDNFDAFEYPRLVDPLVGIAIEYVACGGYHSWAMTKAGALYTWGCNAVGQLGLGDEHDRSTPTLQQSLRSQKIKYVACGEVHSAFLSEEGHVFTCGAGADGQLGHSTTEDSANPQVVSTLVGSVITQLACGRRHTVVYVPKDHAVYTFGQRWFNQLGFGQDSSHDFTTPSCVMGPWTSSEEIRGNTIKTRGTSTPPMSVMSLSSMTSHSMKCLYAGSYYTVAQVSSKKSSLDFRVKAHGVCPMVTLTLEKVKEIVRLPITKPVPDTMKQYIRNALSVCCVSGFFLTSGDDSGRSSTVMKESVSCTKSDPRLNVTQVQDVFAELSRAKNPVVNELLLNAIEALILNLGSDPVDIEGLVIYLALPECHFFHDPVHYATTSLPFAKAFCRLPKSSRMVLLGWWTCNSANHFKTIASVYKGSLLYILQLPPACSRLENLLRSQSVQMSVRVLSHLCWMNKKKNLGLPDNTFQVPALEDYIDLVQDYANWIRDRRSKKGKHTFHFCSYPYILGGAAKATLLRADAEMHQRRAMKEAVEWNVLNLFVPVGKRNPYLTLRVSRKNIVGDTLKQLADCNRKDLKKPLRIVFEGEDAVDNGGLCKEFFTLFMRDALDPRYGLFIETEGGSLWFNQYSFDSDSMYALVGIACGLAAYNNSMVAARFPLALYKMLLKEKTSLSDLADLYPSIMRGLRQLLHYKFDDVEQVFQLTFQASQEFYGKSVDAELKPGGTNIPVNQENKREYVHLYLEYLVYRSVKEKIIAFSTGFRKVCSSCVLNVFRSEELRRLLVGSEEYSWSELQNNTQYKGEFCSSHPTIRAFWKVFHKLELFNKKKFLLFLTGSDRVPVIGMKEIKIIIRPLVGSEDYLPIAHTCFNMLDLPIYVSQKRLRLKLLQAIEYVEGFSQLG